MQRRVFLKSGALALVTLGLSPSFLRRAVYAQALRREAQRIGVHISPRFGEWSQQTVEVVPTTDDLSTPGKGGSTTANPSDLGQ